MYQGCTNDDDLGERHGLLSFTRSRSHVLSSNGINYRLDISQVFVTVSLMRHPGSSLHLLVTGLHEVYIGCVCGWVNRCILSWFRHRRSSAADVDDDGSQCDVSDTHPGHLLLGIIGSSSTTRFVV